MNKRYGMRDVFCDSVIYDTQNNNEPILILNSRANANLICKIMNDDNLKIIAEESIKFNNRDEKFELYSKVLDLELKVIDLKNENEKLKKKIDELSFEILKKR